jgi:hypothetical protein
MHAPLYFQAPWCRSLRVVSTLATVVLVGVGVLGWTRPGLSPLARLATVLVPGLLLALTALWTIRGYQLSAGVLQVRRLLRATRLPLAGLVSAQADATATRGSLRLCGNGGLFSFSGLYWNRRFGRYRMFATDPQRAVVLTFASGIVIVTPEAPEAFVVAVRPAAALRMSPA